jgi:hypothetical protein
MGNFEEIGLDRGAGGVVAGAWRPPGIAVCNISDAKLEHCAEKWKPVFRKNNATTRS